MGSEDIGTADWNCVDCSFSNWARRDQCFECNAPRNKERSGTKSNKDEEAPSDEQHDGDWDCSSCHANNFSRRNKCFKCRANKDGTPNTDNEDKFEFRNGDWSCSGCGTHNFARRSSCFQCRKSRPDAGGERPDAGGERPDAGGERPDAGGDWHCTGCNTNNFARRSYCFGCQIPKQPTDNGSRDNGPRTNYYDANRNNGYTDYNRTPRGMRNGDWSCESCNFHNFARRNTCKDCGEVKKDGEQRVGNVKPGDWTCAIESCGENNFARRTKCFKCEEPKSEGDIQ